MPGARALRARITALALGAAFAAGCARTAVSPAGPAPVDHLRVVPLGLCEDYPEESRTAAGAREDLRMLAAAGVGTLRVGIGWDDVEPEPGRFEWAFWDELVGLAGAHGVRLIP